MVESRYRPDIDGLRALAVLLVIGYHAAPGHIPGGFIGVDIFFVISGFLITGIIVRDVEEGRFSFLGFYARRCRRIVPALAVVLAATWLIGWRTLLSTEFDELGQDVAAGATFTTNIVLWQQWGYFATAAASKPLLHLWSLAVEEQFYLVWPLLLFYGLRRNLSIGGVTAVLAVASFALNAILIRHYSTLTFYLLPTRFWELMIGAWLAWAADKDRWIDAAGVGPIGQTLALVALAAIVIAAVRLNQHDLYPGWRALVPTLATATLIMVGRRAWIVRVPLASPVPVFVGLISYPLYLWHWPLLSIAQISEERILPHAIRWPIVAASVLLASLTWVAIERPIRMWLPNGATRLRGLQFVGASVCALIVVATTGWTAHVHQGFPRRYPVLERLANDLSYRDYQRRRGAFQRCSGDLVSGHRLQWCETSMVGAPAMAILGDSHAEHLFPGIAAASETNWMLLAQSQCAPLFDIRVHRRGTSQTCADLNQTAVRLVTQSSHIGTIVLAMRGGIYSGDVRTLPREELEPPVLEATSEPRMAGRDLFLRGVDEEITQFEAAGRDVVLFIDVPELDFEPSACVDIRPFRIALKALKSVCSVSTVTALARQAHYRGIMERLASAHPRTRIYDPFPIFCDETRCYAQRDGQMLYRDWNHLNLNGSRRVAAAFLKWLGRRG